VKATSKSTAWLGSAALAAAVVVTFLLCVRDMAVGGDSPNGRPPASRLDDSILAKHMVGDWLVAVQTFGARSSATSRITVEMGRTALVERYEEGDYHVLSVFRVTNDNRISCWTFDSVTSEPSLAVGAVAGSRATLEGVPRIDLVFLAEGFDSIISAGSRQIVKREYRRK